MLLIESGDVPCHSRLSSGVTADFRPSISSLCTMYLLYRYLFCSLSICKVSQWIFPKFYRSNKLDSFYLQVFISPYQTWAIRKKLKSSHKKLSTEEKLVLSNYETYNICVIMECFAIKIFQSVTKPMYWIKVSVESCTARRPRAGLIYINVAD